MGKVSELVRELTSAGWYLHKHGANHDLYRHRDKPGQLTVPRHGSKELAKGTEQSIRKAAGLNR
jgi:predicted RNA binding protein YcfA (HicA-like mRNA interferase family)